MARILLIETSTSVLSVALAVDGTVACERVCEEPRKQASLTAPLVKEVLDEAGLSARELDAVCVSSGPGSYTGLRVGVSTAKGVAFGAGIPLLSIGTLDILVSGVSGEGAPQFIVPMIDARRMEVYTAVYSAEGKRLTPVEAKVIGPDAFREYSARKLSKVLPPVSRRRIPWHGTWLPRPRRPLKRKNLRTWRISSPST